MASGGKSQACILSYFAPKSASRSNASSSSTEPSSSRSAGNRDAQGHSLSQIAADRSSTASERSRMERSQGAENTSSVTHNRKRAASAVKSESSQQAEPVWLSDEEENIRAKHTASTDSMSPSTSASRRSSASKPFMDLISPDSAHAARPTRASQHRANSSSTPRPAPRSPLSPVAAGSSSSAAAQRRTVRHVYPPVGTLFEEDWWEADKENIPPEEDRPLASSSDDAGDAGAETSGSKAAPPPAEEDEENERPLPAQQPPRQAPKKAKAAASASKRGRQLVIDVGQKSLRALDTCRECGAMYTRGVPEDEALHARIHRRHTHGIDFPGWKKERVVGRFDEGARIVMVAGKEDLRLYRRKVEEVLEVVSKELGYATDPNQDPAAIQVYLYVSARGKVVGCAVAEAVGQGFRVLPAADGCDGTTVCRSTEPVACQVGVRQLWVAPGHRRAGVARRLLDALRTNFRFGGAVERAEVAFSQPTPSGKAFAERFTGRPDFLVYS
eukprot:tig00001299_g8071.t1